MSNQHFQSLLSVSAAFSSCSFCCFSPSKSSSLLFPDQTLSLMANVITAAGKRKCASVYLNPRADRNPRGKGKEQQIRRFADCQHSNGSEKYKTELLTTQGNKCSCGKNHTLMPISLIALWFRQRAEWRGAWARRAALLWLSCHLGSRVLALPLVVFAFSFATFQHGTGDREGPTVLLDAGAHQVCSHALVRGAGLSQKVWMVSPLPAWY